MDLLEAIGQRHSVRSYEDRPIEADAKEELEKYIEKLNEESGLHMQLITDEPKAFTGLKVLIVAGYGSFTRKVRILRREACAPGPAVGTAHLLGRRFLPQGAGGL